MTILDSHSIIFGNCLKKGLVYVGNPHHISQDRLLPDLSPAGMISSVPRTLQLFIFRLEPRFKETKKRSNLTSSGIRVDLSLIYPVSSLKQFFFFFARSKEVKASDSSSWKKEWCSKEGGRTFGENPSVIPISVRFSQIHTFIKHHLQMEMLSYYFS